MNGNIVGAVKTPWHLWVIATLASLWNAGGVFSWFTIMFGDPADMGFTPDMVAYLESYPAWALVTYTMGTWGALLGSIALFFRSKWATPLFVIAIVGLLGTTIHERVTSELPEAFQSSGQLIFTFVIWGTTLGLMLYSRFLSGKGVLK